MRWRPTSATRPRSSACATGRSERGLGAASILVNAAGVFGPIALIKDSDPAEWVATITTDAVAPYLTTRAFVGGDDRRRLGAHRQRHLGGVAAPSRSAQQRLRHRQGRAQPVHPPPRRRVRRHGRDGQRHPPRRRQDRHVGRHPPSGRMAAGPAAEAYQQWVAWVDETGGDPPHKAVDAVLGLCDDAAADINGRFCWIDDPLQAPIPSWDTDRRCPAVGHRQLTPPTGRSSSAGCPSMFERPRPPATGSAERDERARAGRTQMRTVST